MNSSNLGWQNWVKSKSLGLQLSSAERTSPASLEIPVSAAAQARRPCSRSALVLQNGQLAEVSSRPPELNTSFREGHPPGLRVSPPRSLSRVPVSLPRLCPEFCPRDAEEAAASEISEVLARSLRVSSWGGRERGVTPRPCLPSKGGI